VSRRNALLALALLLLGGGVAACGKKGALHAPPDEAGLAPGEAGQAAGEAGPA
jgi:predicted small lipoprotein YifL